MSELGSLRGLAVNFTALIDQLGQLAAQFRYDLDVHRIFGTHGDLHRWASALEQLPDVISGQVSFGDTVKIGTRSDLDSAASRQCSVFEARAGARANPCPFDALRSGLARLCPWRKGPFEIFGVTIDSEWRSDWKWRRVQAHARDLRGCRVLDVGCGNGYYGWRMLEAGARRVIGCDPTLNSVIQHLEIAHYVGGSDSRRHLVLPVRIEELPRGEDAFDTVFSMGVLYHQRDPLSHLIELYERLRPGGELVIESLVAPGRAPIRPEGRYARMRNVSVIPDEDTLVAWLRQVGLDDARIVDVTRTTVHEQRRTEWMAFESLGAALDPRDPQRTVEGHPAPVRAIAVARRPH